MSKIKLVKDARNIESVQSQEINAYVEKYKKQLRQENRYLDISAEEKNLRELAAINLKKDMKYIALNSDTMLFKGEYDNTKDFKVKPPADKVAKSSSVFDGLNKGGFFDVVSGKNSTGSNLIKKTIDLSNSIDITPVRNRNILDVNEVKLASDNLRNIYDNGGYVTTFDLETIGGPNKYGHSQQDIITEMSATVFEYKPGQNHLDSDKAIHETFDTVLGINNGEYKQVMETLDRIEKSGVVENRDAVMLGRMEVYGDEGTTLKDVKNFRVGLATGANSSNLNSTDIKERVTRAKKGAEFLFDTGKKQEQWVLNNAKGHTFESYRTKEIEAFKDFVFHGKGANKGKDFGANDNWIFAGHNSKNFDARALRMALGSSDTWEKGKHFDLLPMLQYIEENNPNAQLLKDANGNEIILDGRYGKNQLENLARTHGLLRADRPSHIAREDQEAFFRTILPNQPGQSDNQRPVFDHVQEAFNTTYDSNKHKYSQGLDDKLFLSNGLVAHWNDGNENKSLGFSFDPVNNEYKTYNGYSVGKKGVTKEGYKEFGPKSNMLLTHKVSELEVNSDEMEKIFRDINGDDAFNDKLFQEFSKAKKLYVLESEEYIDQDIATGILGVNNIHEDGKKYYTITDDLSQISSITGTVAQDENGKITKAMLDEDFVKDFIEKNGKHNRSELSKENILAELKTRTAHARINDSAYRSLRDGDAKKLFEAQQNSEKVKAEFGNSAKTSEEIARIVSKNKTVGGYDDALLKAFEQKKMMGFTFKGKYNVTSDSLKKASALNAMFEGNEDFFRTVNEVLDNATGSAAGITSHADWEKRGFALSHIMENLATDYADNPDVIEAYYKKAGVRINNPKDKNILDIKTRDIDTNKSRNSIHSSIGKDSKGITQLDMSSEFKFFKPFQEAAYGNRDIKFEGEQGLRIIEDAYDKISNVKEYKNLLDGFDKSDILKFQQLGADGNGIRGNYRQLAANLMGTVKRNVAKRRDSSSATKNGTASYLVWNKHTGDRDSIVVESDANIKNTGDKNFGYLFSRNPVDAQSPEFLQAIQEQDTAKLLKGQMENYLKDMPNMSFIDKNGATESMVNSLVDNHLFNIKKSDFLEQIKGYDIHKQKILTANFDLARTDATEYAQEIFKGVSQTNATLAINNDANGNSVIGAYENGEFRNLKTYTYGIQDGAVYANIGNDRYASHLSIDSTSMYTEGRRQTAPTKVDISNVGISNNFRVSRQGKSLENMTKRQMQDGGYSGLDSLEYAMGKVLGTAAYKKVRIEKNNFIAFEKGMQINTDGFIPLLVDSEDEVLKAAKDFYGNDKFYTDEVDGKQFKDMIKRIKKLRADGQSTPMGIEDLLANEKNLINIKFLDPIKQWAKGKMGDDIGSQEGIVDYILSSITTTFTKDTNVMKGQSGLIGEFIDPSASFDDIKRPPVTQKGKVVISDIEEVKLEAAKHAKRVSEGGYAKLFENINATLNPVLTSSIKEKFAENVGGKHTGAVSLTQMQINSETLRGVYLNDYEKNNKSKYREYVENNYGHLDEFDKEVMMEKLHKRAMLVSTYEQQGLVDGRVSDTFFNQTNVQTIEDKKVMIAKMGDNLETTRQLNLVNKTKFTIDENGNIKYQIGKHFNQNEKLFEYAKEITDTQGKSYRSNYEGIISGVYLDERGMKVKESELQKSIEDIYGVNGLSVADAKNKTEAMADAAQKARDVLDAKYQWGYKIIGNQELGGVKISSTASEKATVDTGKMITGSLDSTVSARIQEMADGLNNGNHAKILRGIDGVVAEKSYLDKAETIIRANGGDELFEDILKERYAFSDLTQGFKQLEGTGLFLAVDAVKHSSVSQGMFGAFEKIKEQGLLTEENLDAILGEASYKLKDDRVFLDAPDRMSITKHALMDRGLSEDAATSISDIFKTSERYDKDGNAVSNSKEAAYSKSVVNATQTVDHMDSTVRGNDFEYNEMIKEREDLIAEESLIKQKLADAKITYKDDMKSDEAINAFGEINSEGLAKKNEIASLSDNIEGFKKDKGLKFSSRMHGTLQQQAYTEDSNKLMKEAYLTGEINSGSTMDEAIERYSQSLSGAVDADGNIIKELKHTRVLAPVNAVMQGQLMLGEGEESLGAVEDRMRNISSRQEERDEWLDKIKNAETPEIEAELRGNAPAKVTTEEAQELVNFNQRYEQVSKNMPIDRKYDMSIERAEMIHSFTRGESAMHFNESRNASRSALYEDGFKLVDLSEASKAKDWMPVNISGDAKYAMAQHNNPYTNNLIIKTGLKEEGYSHIASGAMPLKMFGDDIGKSNSVKALERVQMNIMAMHENTISGDVGQLETNLKNSIDTFKDEQRKDLASKTGLFGQLTERRMSQSAFVRGRGMTIQKHSVDGINLMGGDTGMDFDTRLAEFDKVNSGMSKMMYQGESINSHFLKDRKIDVVQLSEKTFKDMGYFEEKFMDSVMGQSNLNISDKREQMMQLLETQGDSFLATRYPEIMEGSDKMTMGYLNRGLKPNEAIAVGHTGMSMKLDHDGDKFAVKRMNLNGMSSLHRAMGIEGGEGFDNYMRSFDNSIMRRALVENQYWDRSVDKQLAKEFKVAAGGSAIADLASKTTINGSAYAAISFDQNQDYKFYQDNYNNYSGLIGEAEEKFSSMSAEDISSNGYTNANDIVMENINSGNHKNLSEEGLAMARGYEAYRGQNVSKIFKSAVGEVNVTAFKVKTAFTALIDEGSEDYDYNVGLMHDMFYWSEEAAISAKKNIKGLDPGRAKVFNENIMKIINHDERNGVSLEESEGTLRNWVNEYIMDETNLDYHYSKSSKFRDMASEFTGANTAEEFIGAVNDGHEGVATIKTRMVDDYMSIIKKGAEHKDFGTLIQTFDAQTSGAGLSSGRYRKGKLLDLATQTNDTLIRRIISEVGTDELAMETAINQKINTDMRSMADSFGGIYSENNSKKMSLDGIMESGAEMFKSIKGSNLALGALGVAAAVMAVGFAGGRPRPADTQAMEEASNTMQPAGTGMVLSDTGYQNPAEPQGYVVNINAKTNRGRDNAVGAIQQAISSATQSNVNISMNVNDEYGNASDADIRESIWGAF